MVGMANANMGVRSIRQQVASAVDLFVQVSRFSDGTRRVTHITEVIGMEGRTSSPCRTCSCSRRPGITEDGKVTRPFPRHRHPSQVLRTPEGLRHQRCRRSCSRRWWRSARCRSRLHRIFWSLFFRAHPLRCALGLKFYECARARSRCRICCSTASGGARGRRSPACCKEIEPRKAHRVKAWLSTLQFSRESPGADPAGRA